MLGYVNDAEALEWGMRQITVARCFERIGDNAVDIGEQTAFVVTGEFAEFTDASTISVPSSSAARFTTPPPGVPTPSQPTPSALVATIATIRDIRPEELGLTMKRSLGRRGLAVAGGLVAALAIASVAVGSSAQNPTYNLKALGGSITADGRRRSARTRPRGPSSSRKPARRR